MSDDGLMLNFVAPTTSVQQRRVSTKRRHEHPRTKISKPAASSQSQPHASTSAASSPPLPVTRSEESTSKSAIPNAEGKARNQTSEDQTLTSLTNFPDPRHSQSSSKNAGPSAGRSGIISSLFTGDKVAKGRTSTQAARDHKEYLPTNAPSTSSEFATLGLDPLLIAHLQSSKMAISRPTSIQRKSLPFLLDHTNAGRDVLLHAQTGSGKTLSYLLPIIQSLLPLCETSWIDRSSLGTVALILAPTRELAHQIQEVAEKLCSLHLATKSSTEGGHLEEETATRRTRWIVPGLLSGGATRNHEKSRLRKGLPIIVATPGRLLDHLRNTSTLDVGRLQWLVLDEADRLLQLGFEQTLSDIMKAIDGRRRAACEVQRDRMLNELGSQALERIVDEEVIDTFGETWWRFPRRTVLCSATLDEGVQVLAGKSLSNPRVIRGETEQVAKEERSETVNTPAKSISMAAPAQLRQKYVVMPTKQRLIILLALLRHAVATGKPKVMVFLSCTDSVDFHWLALGGVKMGTESSEDGQAGTLERQSELLPSTSVFKLHGSMSQHERQSSLRLFSQRKQPSILLCTSVASRGLDLDISLVVQLDPPSERGVDEYLHRIGRTARVGEQGESWLLLLPSEESCIVFYEGQMGTQGVIEKESADVVIQRGFTGQDLWQTQARATEVQMAFERWVVQTEEHANLARRAYLSHLRAYATHPPAEREYFSLSNLQLGHLAKAFALREAPGVIRQKFKSSAKASSKAEKASKEVLGTQQPGERKRKRSGLENGGIKSTDGNGSGDEEDDDEVDANTLRKYLDFARNKDTEARMYAKVREMGKLNRRGGVLGAYGVDEYQVSM